MRTYNQDSRPRSRDLQWFDLNIPKLEVVRSLIDKARTRLRPQPYTNRVDMKPLYDLARHDLDRAMILLEEALDPLPPSQAAEPPATGNERS